MAYSTGSGNYTALMAAILAFAIGDGWTATVGNWPISKGNVRGVDWSTFTATEKDYTASGGANITARYIRFGIGTSKANATSNAAATATSAVMANAHYTFSNWWLFSDSGAGKPNYISGVVQFSNGVNADCFAHFSFGELDKHGMAHTATVYATASTNRGYSFQNDASSYGNQALDFNGGQYGRIYKPYTGFVTISYGQAPNQNNLVVIIDPTINPIPVAGAFPAADTVLLPTNFLDMIKTGDANESNINSTRNPGASRSMSPGAWATLCQPQPFSGAVSMVPLPLILLNNTGSSAQMVMLGSFPNVRVGSIESYVAADEVTYASENWKMFPMLKSTAYAQMQLLNTVSSGRVSFIHKKVT